MTGGIAPRASAEVRYGVLPTRRGRYELGDIFLRWRMELGLVIRQRRIPACDAVKVYPNVSSLARYELAVQRHRTTEMGLMPVRLRGRGSTFESLRDYVAGDDLADAAWKATARHGRLIIRNYETERSQNVLVMLDCGRLMVPQVAWENENRDSSHLPAPIGTVPFALHDQLSRLDCAINATLLLSYVAMKQGDYIGLVGFSDRIEAYVPPVKGRGAGPHERCPLPARGSPARVGLRAGVQVPRAPASKAVVDRDPDGRDRQGRLIDVAGVHRSLRPLSFAAVCYAAEPRSGAVGCRRAAAAGGLLHEDRGLEDIRPAVGSACPHAPLGR